MSFSLSTYASIIRTTLAMFAASAFFGCVSEMHEPEEGEETGEAMFALCSDVPLTADKTLQFPSSPGSWVQATSPSATYGSSACTNNYIVDFTGTQGEDVKLGVSWGESLPNIKEACGLSFVTATAYGYKPASTWYLNGRWGITPASWVKLGVEETAVGTWVDEDTTGISLPTGCYLNHNLAAPGASNYDKVRVVAKAAAFAIVVIPPKKVRVWAENPEVIQ